MQDNKHLLDKLQQQLASSTDTQTEAGRTRPAQDKEASIDAINQVFAEFELVYHNQYIKAFPTVEKLQYAKKLWLSHLAHVPAAQIVQAAHRAIKESEYLPTIRGLLKFCETELDFFGLPNAHNAYVEACMAKAPQDRQHYSHPAVYFAGKTSGWFFLATQPESRAYPIFEQNYAQICHQVRQGLQLKMPEIKALSERIDKPLDAAQQQAEIKKLRESLQW